MILNEATNLIRQFEGLRLKPYYDTFGCIWSVGYGFTEYDNKKVTENYPLNLTEQDCIDELERLVSLVLVNIKELVKVDLNDNQYAALCSFTYNVGISNFEHSTLLKLINENELEAASEQFLLWNHSGGKIVTGLTNRRAAEKRLFDE